MKSRQRSMMRAILSPWWFRQKNVTCAVGVRGIEVLGGFGRRRAREEEEEEIADARGLLRESQPSSARLVEDHVDD